MHYKILSSLALLAFATNIANAQAISPSDGLSGLSSGTVINVNAESSEDHGIKVPSPLSHIDVPNTPSEDFHPKSAEAEKIIGTLKFCSDATEMKARLSCYEDLARHVGVNVPVANNEGEVKPQAKWMTEEDTDGKKYVAMLTSGTVFRKGNDLDNTTPVKFYFRCDDSSLSLYFGVGTSIGKSNVNVEIIPGMNINGGVGTSYPMTPSTSGTSFGLWNDQQARVLGKYFLSAKEDGFTMVAHLNTDDDKDSIIAKFDLSDIETGTQKVREACSL